MNHDDAPAYGLWSLVRVNSLIFIIFAFSFTRPRTNRDWRSFGAFPAFHRRIVIHNMLSGVRRRFHMMQHA